MEKERNIFNSKVGFILACVGSAVGIGNVWLFPWRVGEFGGAIFLIQYFLLVLFLGVIGLIGEFTLGRLTGTGPIGSFEQAFQTRNIKWGGWIGFIPVLGALGIAVGYSVVVGWILRYTWGSIDGTMLNSNVETYFTEMTGDFGSVRWHILAVLFTTSILSVGVSKGIEKANKIMMPLFYILFTILLVRVLTLPNMEKGLSYLLIPKWEVLQDPKAWAIALGQAFFSLSLAGSGMVVYGSYIKKDVNIVNASIQTALYSSIGALLCAFVIIPAVFAYGLDPTVGPPLVFLTLPLVFQQMLFGQLFAILFFTSILFAAITSLINLMECPIEALQNRFNIPRIPAVLIVGITVLGIGLFIESVDKVSIWMDFISIYIIPIGASLAAIIIFWIFGIDIVQKEISHGNNKALPKWFSFYTKYIFVGITIIIVLLSITKSLY